MAIEEVLIVRHKNDLYGIDTNAIEHILKIQDITPVPLAPKAVRGLCSIEGGIMTVLDLSVLLLDDKVDTGLDAARMISMHVNEKRYALLVEEVLTNVIIDAHQIEYISAEKQRKDGVQAIYKYQDEIMQILDLHRLIELIEMRSFSKRSMSDRYANSDEQKVQSNERTRRFLLIRMGSESYAIDVYKIREVITVPESLTHIADASDEVMGMITLRGELITIVDLRKIYELETKKGDHNRIIILQSQSTVLGVYIDEIVDIADFPASAVDTLPSNFKDEKVTGVIEYQNELVSLIESRVLDTLLAEQSYVENSQVQEQNSTETDTEVVELVTFRLSEGLYALHTTEVIEIIDNFEITVVPDMPLSVKGVTNIRGKVIPVVSVYEKLELQEHEKNQKIIVCHIDEKPVAMLVDEVCDVSDIQSSAFSVEEESPYFSHITKSKEGDLILMLNLETLLEDSKEIM